MPRRSPRLLVLGLVLVLGASLVAVPLLAAPTVDGLLERAARALSAGDDAAALDHLEAASRHDDAGADVLVALARLQLRRGDLRAAQRSAGAALARAPGRADALALEGDILRAAGRLDEARGRYRAALAADPNEPRARAGKARLFLEDGDREGALALDPALDADALALRLAWADAEAKAGDLRAAIAKLDAILARHPDYVGALVRRGDFHRRLGEIAAAHRDLETAVGVDAVSPEARFRRGLLKRDLEDLEAARDDFNRAIALDPDFVPAYVARGALYQAAGHQAAAIRDFELALEIDPSHTDALTHIAASECARAEFARCLDAADGAIRARADDWRAHVARGHALLGQNAADAAVEAYGAAVGHAPAGEAHWLLAKLQKHLRPRLEEQGGFGWSWQFLAAHDVDEVEDIMADHAAD